MALRADVREVLDPTIVRLPLFWEQAPHIVEPLFLYRYRSAHNAAKTGFWSAVAPRWAAVRSDWEPHPQRLETAVFQQRSFDIVSEARVEALASASTLSTDVRQQDVPYAITNMMTEASPQFTLRNLPRVERSIDLDRRPPFVMDELPLAEATAALDEARHAEVPRVEFPESWSAPLLDDFRIFLEEILYLCPWEQMPHGVQPPPEDSLWSTNHSRATLTYELLAKRDKVFVWGHAGGPKTVARDGRVARRKARTDEPEGRMG